LQHRCVSRSGAAWDAEEIRKKRGHAMSHGPGKWERAIIAAVDASPDGVPRDFLRPNNRSGKEAFSRAARSMEDKGLIIIVYDDDRPVLRKPPVLECPVIVGSVEVDPDVADTDAASEIEDAGDPWQEIGRQVEDATQEDQQPTTARPKKGEWPGKRVEDAELLEEIGGHGFRTKEFDPDWIDAINKPKTSSKNYKRKRQKAEKELDKADRENTAHTEGNPEHKDDRAQIDLAVEQPDEVPEHAYAHDEGSPLESADEREGPTSKTADGGKVTADTSDLSPRSTRRPIGHFANPTKGYNTRAAPPRSGESKAQQAKRLWKELENLKRARAREEELEEKIRAREEELEELLAEEELEKLLAR
jgi:hypothetical protein